MIYKQIVQDQTLKSILHLGRTTRFVTVLCIYYFSFFITTKLYIFVQESVSYG